MKISIEISIASIPSRKNKQIPIVLLKW